jgi:hypothetical protein
MRDLPCPDPQWLERCIQVWLIHQEEQNLETPAKSLTEHILGNWVIVVQARRRGITESKIRVAKPQLEVALLGGATVSTDQKEW